MPCNQRTTAAVLAAALFFLPEGHTAPPAPRDGDWPMATLDYANTRYSPLTQVDARNVSSLKVEFTFSTGVARGQEAAPIIVGDTMYIVTPFPNVVYALDLSRPGAPTKWKYESRPRPPAQGVACCDVVNRGVVFWEGRIIFNTLDGRTIALDANDGKRLWETQLADINIGETITMAPMVVKGKVLVGNSGGEFGVRGWLVALDAKTGKTAWKAWSTGPDSDVLIGPAFKPYYASERGKDLGKTTWPPDAWKIGGGTVWGWISYDPKLDLIYYGTGNAGPWNAEQRPGDNKWTAGMFARDPDDGQARWFYQFSPHDLFDYDAINESVLVDLNINGQLRPVIVRPERNGYLYVMDRATGQLLSADAFVPVNAIDRVDLKTGRPHWNTEKQPSSGKVTRQICPAAPGAKDWNPSAWSPQTGLLYVPHNNLCMDWQPNEVNYIAGTPYVGADAVYYAGPGGNRGLFTAWDPVARKAAWQIREDLPVWSGTLTTAGGLVFYGTMDGWFKAVDARSGKLLWQFKTDSGIIGQPVSYRGPDGRQYIAVLSGIGGWPGAVVVNNLDTRDATAAAGWGSALPDLKDRTTAGGTLYVFSLPR
ncbi:methanol/ethanol family PQQ-dependent dehydrogenase [Lysobacter auxotrophicus]|uniref:Methanol/ethanol family PQQ-dependent dehydrogenase n=1 Tax=Lysobacter auxotrophicus TaxID=2992573 RepID=A0ABN6UJL9_9GAMM|nr:methanol/ethanol family PQQ-dependent dehydrogenase [Lysobacter auxotrophicus]BDU16426.1 methanol/ethanol family PQQ-dependent dehydrogenase [Lysobacter auxotrophicus]